MVENSSSGNIEYVEEINSLNKLNESLIWKTKHEKPKWNHFAMEKKSSENDILETSHNARISELKQ